MLPDDTLSSVPHIADWMYTYPTTFKEFVAFEQGGVALEDISQGLDSHLWKLSYDEDTLNVSLNRVGEVPQVVFTATNLVRLGLVFDQNMHPSYVWEDGLNGVVNLMFYDTATNSQETIVFNGITSPCITLDDKRVGASDTSDIIFAYIKDGDLCYRQQRDRFTIERVLGSVNPTEIITRIGMSQGGRLLMELRGIAP